MKLFFIFIFSIISIANSHAQVSTASDSYNTIYTIEEGEKIIQNGQVILASKPYDNVDVTLPGFDKYFSEQQNMMWCWAACIQMVINQRDIQFEQKEIVRAIQGNFDWSTATEEQIKTFLNGWKFFDNGTVRLTTNCFYMRGVPVPNMILRQIGPHGRPLIVSIKNNVSDDEEHLVVLYRALFQVGVGIIDVVIYDPLRNETKVVDWSTCLKTISGSFFTTIVSNQDR